MLLLVIALSMVIMFLAQAVVYRLTWRSKLDVAVNFTRNNVIEGDMVSLVERVENGKNLPIVSLKVNLNVDRHLQFPDSENTAVSDRNYHSEIFAMGRKSVTAREVPCFCAKRGYYTIPDVFMVSNDIFYTQRLVAAIPQDDALYVYPGRVDARRFFAATERMIGELLSPDSNNDDPFEFRGIREYQTFDSMRSINWKVSAKTQDLKVNVYERTSSQEVKIFLDVSWDTLLRREALQEECIRIAAALAAELIGRGISVSLATNGTDVITGSVFAVTEGAGEHHMAMINRGLARLDVSEAKPAVRMADLLAAEVCQEEFLSKRISYVLISAETDGDMVNEWNKLCAKCVHGWWIAPGHRRRDVVSSVVPFTEQIFWEVPYGK